MCYGLRVSPAHRFAFPALVAFSLSANALAQTPPSAPTTARPASAWFGQTATPPPPATPATTLTEPAVTAPSRPRRPALIRERLRLLDARMTPLIVRGNDGRIANGIISTTIGAALVVLGFVAASELEDSSSATILSASLWVQGGYQVVDGAVSLLWKPAREELPPLYRQQPRGTPHERRLAVRYGEQALEDMASDGARRRIIRTIAGTAVGLSTLGILYRDQIFDGQPMPEPSGIHYLMIGLTALSLVPNLLNLFTRSEEERLRDTYRAEIEILRERHETDEPAPAR